MRGALRSDAHGNGAAEAFPESALFRADLDIAALTNTLEEKFASDLPRMPRSVPPIVTTAFEKGGITGYRTRSSQAALAGMDRIFREIAVRSRGTPPAMN